MKKRKRDKNFFDNLIKLSAALAILITTVSFSIYILRSKNSDSGVLDNERADSAPLVSNETKLEECEFGAEQNKMGREQEINQDLELNLESLKSSEEYGAILQIIDDAKNRYDESTEKIEEIEDDKEKSDLGKAYAISFLETGQKSELSTMRQGTSQLLEIESSYHDGAREEREESESTYQEELNRCAIKYGL